MTDYIGQYRCSQNYYSYALSCSLLLRIECAGTPIFYYASNCRRRRRRLTELWATRHVDTYTAAFFPFNAIACDWTRIITQHIRSRRHVCNSIVTLALVEIAHKELRSMEHDLVLHAPYIQN